MSLEIIPNLHPLVVHFPIVLISLSAFFHLLATFTTRKSCAVHCRVLAHTTLWLSALSALPAVFFGWQAFNSVSHDEAGHLAMLIHRSWALGSLAILTGLAGWDFWKNKVDQPTNGWFSLLVAAAWVVVSITAWHGGELVYRHGLGVISLPAEEADHDHVHSHAHDSTDEDSDHVSSHHDHDGHDHDHILGEHH